MTTYLLRRAATSVIILVGISILAFWMLHVIGGPPGRAVLGLRASQASVERLGRASTASTGHWSSST